MQEKSKRADRIAVSLAFALFGAIILGCSMLPKVADKTADNANVTTRSSNITTSATPAASANAPKVEKADFTTTAEALDAEYTRKGVKDADLEKYAGKNIAVAGRVSTLVLEKKGATQPWVTLYAPGTLHGVNCYFDDENVGQMKQLKMDKKAKVQGFQDTFIVPGISPMLKHCVVLEADN